MTTTTFEHRSNDVRTSLSAAMTGTKVQKAVASYAETAVSDTEGSKRPFRRQNGRFGRRMGTKTRGYENECQRRAKERVAQAASKTQKTQFSKTGLSKRFIDAIRCNSIKNVHRYRVSSNCIEAYPITSRPMQSEAIRCSSMRINAVCGKRKATN